MSCPHYTTSQNSDEDQQGFNAVEGGGMAYGHYLKLDKLLGAQVLASEENNNLVPDEHLFIITHQAYELWFKQIIYDLDIVLQQFQNLTFDERRTLMIVSKLERIVKILKLLVDQILLLETMSPLDFVEFRKYLAPASGFQSLQFRILENKLGIRSAQRVKYNAQHYQAVFKDQDHKTLMVSENDKSLFQLVEKWLERTPGVDRCHFFNGYCEAVKHFLKDTKEEVMGYKNPKKRETAMKECDKLKASYDSIIDPLKHLELMESGDRRFSHQALQGALMIMFHRDQPRLSQPYQVLSLLMDIDSLLIKWRQNHVLLVQRMLGTKIGTGGSSGYMYLRSTCSDRYKVFLDLFNLSTYLIPRAYIPPLSKDLSRKLSCTDMVHDRIEFELANRKLSSSYLIHPENMYGNEFALAPQRHPSGPVSSVPTTDYSDDGVSASELSQS